MKHIRTKLWLGTMVLVGIIILLLWLFQIVFLEKFYSVLEINEVTKSANLLTDKIEELDDIKLINESDTIIELVDSLVNEKQISIWLMEDANQTIFQRISGNNANIPNVLKEAIIEGAFDALAGKTTKKQVIHPKFGYEFVVITMPVYHGSTITNTLSFAFPMAQVKDTVFILKRQLIIIIIILLLVSALLSFTLSKSFTKPILDISKVAKSYESGNFNSRVKSAGNDEIGQLAERMNHMGEALIRNERLQKEIIANVSHELRTPLTLIRGYAETLRDVTGENKEKREKQLGVIIDESERLSQLVEDILNLSRLESGAINITMEVFSLKDMLIGIRERYLLKNENIMLELRGVDTLQDNVIGDSKRIEQVFYNLINNAIRHTKDNKPVVAELIQKKDYVRVEIIDQGEGIAQEDMKYIFERYYRGKRAQGKKESGTGLGLAIVKSILELHKAPYGVESERHVGSTFWFELKKENSHTFL